MTRTFDTTRVFHLLAAALLALTLIRTPASAQNPTPQPTPIASNAVYLELFGNALLYSVNYDRRFNDTWTGRLGFMVASIEGFDGETGDRVDVSVAIVPVMANALLGRGTHRLELGIGPLFALGGGEIENAEVGEVQEFEGGGLAGVTSTFGYRRQPVDGGFVFRASLNPFYSGKPQLWAGISFGWAF